MLQAWRHTKNLKLDDSSLFEDWASLVRRYRRILTREQYRREGEYSPAVFEKHFGPWSAVPARFREYAKDMPEWGDVLALLPAPAPGHLTIAGQMVAREASGLEAPTGAPRKHPRLADRPTYGNPIDFRGLRHEPINEQGVVFLFGMIAKELGYLVEAMQTGFPDCEAK